ncbi:MAG: CPBP family intramembrane metalloprotease [Proteobacteria bacterium]|nr:CPBP family intramembrane metalloprotease [Pseudomonadota bacterium]
MPEISFILLGAAILAVWWPARTPIAPWAVFFIFSLGFALAGGTVTPVALPGLALLLLASQASVRHLPKAGPWAAGVLALILALHVWPGFHPMTIVDKAVLSPGARAFTLRAGFDKAAAGLILLAFFGKRIKSGLELRRIGVLMLTFSAFGAISTLGLAWLTEFVRPDPKWPAFADSFLAINLLFTCVAEECFFRGLIQEKLHQYFSQQGKLVPVILSALLFGAAHLPGGVQYAMLAVVAGLSYACAYAHTRRIEAAIFVHFAVNSTHFIGFSYPGLGS